VSRDRTSGGQRTASTERSGGRRPLRRATDPTLLLGDARPLTVGAALAAMAGGVLAAIGPSALAPLAFVLTSVVTVGFLAGARRTDILARPDFIPDRSARSRRVIAAIVILAVVGTVWSAWSITADWAQPIDTPRRSLLTALLSLAGLGVPLAAVWLLDAVRARFRPARQSVVAVIPAAVWPDGSFHRSDTDSVLLVSNDMFEPTKLRRRRRLHVAGLTFAVRNPSSPLRPPIGTAWSPVGPVVASNGVVVEGRSVLGRVPFTLRDTWVFELDPDRTRRAAHDPAAPDFQAAYGYLVLLRAAI
jgi:MFS family permease